MYCAIKEHIISPLLSGITIFFALHIIGGAMAVAPPFLPPSYFSVFIYI